MAMDFLLTDKEYDRIKRDNLRLCSHAAWLLATESDNLGQIDSIRRHLMGRLADVCLRVKKKCGTLDLDGRGFPHFCKQVIWNAQEALRGKVPGLGGTGEEHSG
jgi:hypothetical protein